MYEKAIVAMAKQSVTLEVLSYHASASIEDAQRLRVGLLRTPHFYYSCNQSFSESTKKRRALQQSSINALNKNEKRNNISIQFIVSTFQRLKVPSAAYFQLHDFNFDDIYMDDDDTLRVIAISCTHIHTHSHVSTLSNAVKIDCAYFQFFFLSLRNSIYFMFIQFRCFFSLVSFTIFSSLDGL